MCDALVSPFTHEVIAWSRSVYNSTLFVSWVVKHLYSRVRSPALLQSTALINITLRFMRSVSKPVFTASSYSNRSHRLTLLLYMYNIYDCNSFSAFIIVSLLMYYRGYVNIYTRWLKSTPLYFPLVLSTVWNTSWDRHFGFESAVATPISNKSEMLFLKKIP